MYNYCIISIQLCAIKSAPAIAATAATIAFQFNFVRLKAGVVEQGNTQAVRFQFNFVRLKKYKNICGRRYSNFNSTLCD